MDVSDTTQQIGALMNSLKGSHTEIRAALDRLTTAIELQPVVDAPNLAQLEEILQGLCITLDEGLRNQVRSLPNTTNIKYVQHTSYGKLAIIGWECGTSEELGDVGRPIVAAPMTNGWSYVEEALA